VKKWKTLANPVDPSHWADVSNMWPTGRGSYETADVYGSAQSITAASEAGDGVSAWCFPIIGGSRAYYFGDYLWQFDGSTATDRTGALGAGAIGATGGHACQYGSVTIVSRGTGAGLIYSTGGNFASLAGSPSYKFVVVQSNCVLAFCDGTYGDSWAASDVGDYTNWSTGEAASGRITEATGPITGVVAYGNDVFVLKESAIFRMTYVGGTVKWQIQKVWSGVGCYPVTHAGGSACVATTAGIFFCGGYHEAYATGGGNVRYYLFDGASPPHCVNPETKIGNGYGIPVFCPRSEMVSVYVKDTTTGKNYLYYYSIRDDAWGSASNPILDVPTDNSALPFRGSGWDALFGAAETPALPFAYGGGAAAGVFYVVESSAPTAAAGSCYVQTHKIPGGGDLFAEGQATFGPAVPVLRRRSTYSSGSPALALTVDTYAEAHDSTAAATASVTESTIRDRFDFSKSDSFVQLKLTATDTDIEIDDISCRVIPAGRK